MSLRAPPPVRDDSAGTSPMLVPSRRCHRLQDPCYRGPSASIRAVGIRHRPRQRPM